MTRHRFTIRRAWYAITIWRWWPPVLWHRLRYTGTYDAWSDVDARTAWAVAGMVTQ